jgi:hypothetical protein
MLYAFLVSNKPTSCPVHLVLQNLITRIMYGEAYSLCRISLFCYHSLIFCMMKFYTFYLHVSHEILQIRGMKYMNLQATENVLLNVLFVSLACV